MSRMTSRAEADGVKAVWYGNRNVFIEGETGYAEADKLAHYEDLEEQGRLIELPCGVGDTVYDIGSILGSTAVPHKIETLQFAIFVKHLLNNRFFLTKEEAEARLAELKGTEE